MRSAQREEVIRGVLGIFVFAVALHAVALADEIKHFDVQFQETSRLCDEFFLPNSMARPDFDRQRHMQELEARLRGRAKLFRSPAGIAYLGTQRESGSDDIRRACAGKLLEYATATPANTASQPTPGEGAAER